MTSLKQLREIAADSKWPENVTVYGDFAWSTTSEGAWLYQAFDLGYNEEEFKLIGYFGRGFLASLLDAIERNRTQRYGKEA